MIPRMKLNGGRVGGIGACPLAHIDEWAAGATRFPTALAAHIVHCGACAERVRRVNQVRAGLTLLRTQPMSSGLALRANTRGLRMLRRAERASAEAARVLKSEPSLAWWRRCQLHMTRWSSGLTAAVLAVVLRAGLQNGFEQTRTMGETLAREHWEKHIDPHGEWLGGHCSPNSSSISPSSNSGNPEPSSGS